MVKLFDMNTGCELNQNADYEGDMDVISVGNEEGDDTVTFLVALTDEEFTEVNNLAYCKLFKI